MKLTDNQRKAQQTVESWPSWKKEVSLTKYSDAASGKSTKANPSAKLKVKG